MSKTGAKCIIRLSEQALILPRRNRIIGHEDSGGMLHPSAHTIGIICFRDLYGINKVFSVIPVFFPVSLDELDQVIDADGFVAAAPAVIGTMCYHLAVIDAERDVFSGIASAVMIEIPEHQLLFYREEIEKLEDRFFRGRLIHGKEVAAMTFPDLKSECDQFLRIDIYVL